MNRVYLISTYSHRVSNIAPSSFKKQNENDANVHFSPHLNLMSACSYTFPIGTTSRAVKLQLHQLFRRIETIYH